jgi:hypothetical protein
MDAKKKKLVDGRCFNLEGGRPTLQIKKWVDGERRRPPYAAQKSGETAYTLCLWLVNSLLALVMQCIYVLKVVL